jgi:hypothetical protein
MIKKLYGLLIILSICSLCISPTFAANGDPVLEGKTATGTIVTTGGFVGGTAGTIAGAFALHDAGVLTWWDDGNDFSVTASVTDGTTKLRFLGSLDVSAQVIAGSAIVPDSVGGATIGLATLEWADAYLEDGSIIYFGDDQDVTLTHVADTGLTTNLNFFATTYGSDSSVTDTELLYINTLGSNAQDQINLKAPIDAPVFTTSVALTSGNITTTNGNFVPATSGKGANFIAAKYGGFVSGLTITAGGTGYAAGTLSGTGGGGAGFAGTYTVGGAIIDTVTITNAGIGYTSAPTVVISDAGDANATITALMTLTTSNTLAAYEEGTWTPVAANMAEVGVATYSGSYTKIGERVFVNIVIVPDTSTASTANSTSLTLPFTVGISAPATVVSSTDEDLGNGLCFSDEKVYTPTWVANTNYIFISASYLVD